MIVTSAKKTFFAGGDLETLMRYGPDDAAAVFEYVTRIKGQLRRLETLGLPVVAAVTGTALGGGLEIALACHHRIGLDAPGRGLRAARGDPRAAARRGRRHPDHPHARHRRRLHRRSWPGAAAQARRRAGDRDRRRAGHLPGGGARPGPRVDRGQRPEARQPWDTPGYKIPGGTPSTPKLAADPAGVPGEPAQAAQGRADARRRATSWPRPSRAPRSTSTPRCASRPATSSSWSPGRSPRT